MSQSSTFPFRITPLFTLSQDGIISNLIQIDNLNLLFDCGWNESFSQSIKDKYTKVLSSIKIDAVFLTNNYLNYIGGLPLIKSLNLNSQTEIYATTPIAKLGVYIMADAFISAMEAGVKPLVDLTDAKNNFSKNFFEIKDLKYHQSIKIKSNEEDYITITPIPSGKSLGGCAWKITYKLHTWIYAPEFAIEPNFITDSFNYSELKNKIDIMITDTVMSSQLSVVRTAIEAEFKKKIFDLFAMNKMIFIPTDSVNTSLELIIRFEKLIDEYMNISSNNKKNDTFSEYRILICGYCSKEITEAIKRLTEFMGTVISQQYFLYTDNPFSFKYIQCAKNIDEYKAITQKSATHNYKYVVLSSFPSLNFGLSHTILPLILEDKDAVIIAIKFNDINGCIGELVKGAKQIDYEKRNVIKRLVIKDDEKEKEQEKKEIMKQNEIMNKEEENKREKNLAETIKKSLFAKSEYLMFSYVNKNKFTDYGIVNEKEQKIMKMINVVKSDNYQSAFQGFLNQESNGNLTQGSSGKDFGFKLSKYEIPTEVQIEKTTVSIKCELLSFPLDSNIDMISKKYILDEIAPKEGIVFIGNDCDVSFFSQMNIELIGNEDKYEKKYINNIINFKYDSSLIPKGKHFQIQNHKQNVIDFGSVCLKVKRKRDKIIEITACDLDMENETKKEIKIPNNNEDKENGECFYSVNDLKLLQIKKELEKVTNTSLFIVGKCIMNEDKSVKIKLVNNELVLEGKFSQEYITLRNFINEFFMSEKQE